MTRKNTELPVGRSAALTTEGGRQFGEVHRQSRRSFRWRLTLSPEAVAALGPIDGTATTFTAADRAARGAALQLMENNK